MKAGFDAPLAAGCRAFASRERKLLTSSQSEENVSTIHTERHNRKTEFDLTQTFKSVINKYFF